MNEEEVPLSVVVLVDDFRYLTTRAAESTHFTSDQVHADESRECKCNIVLGLRDLLQRLQHAAVH